MPKCQYEHDGIETCNIDTHFFEYSESEYCYFHQITKVINDMYELMEEHIVDKSKGELKPILYGIENSNNRILFSSNFRAFHIELLQKYNNLTTILSAYEFYDNLDSVLNCSDNIIIDTAGFYFPIENSTIHFDIIQVYDHANPSDIIKRKWNNKIIIEQGKINFYDSLYLASFFDGNKPHLSESHFLDVFYYIYSTFLIKKSAIQQPDNESKARIKLDLSRIDIYGDIKFIMPEVIFDHCNLFSDNIEIFTDKLTILNGIIQSSDKIQQNIIFAVPFENIVLQNTNVVRKLFGDTTVVNLYDSYSDNIYEKQNKQFQGKLENINVKNICFHSTNYIHRNNDFPNLDIENLRKLEFINCKFNDGHKLYEDTHFPTFPEEQRAGVLKRLEYNYRYLRKHYDEKGDYIEGNDFHYNYMEAKKKNSSFWDKLLLYPYGWLNGYNTKPGRTIVWLIILIAITTIINTYWGSFAIKGIYDSGINPDKHDWYTALIYSSANIVPLLNKEMFIPQNIITLQVTMIENLFGTIFIALLLMALRNRFRRSKTPEEIKES